jgi:hypothetical protein
LAAICICAEPPARFTVWKRPQFELKLTPPVKLPVEVTFALSVSGVFWAILLAEAVMVVLDDTGVPPPPPPGPELPLAPPPHPTRKLRRATEAKLTPIDADHRLRGPARKNSAQMPAAPPIVHQNPRSEGTAANLRSREEGTSAVRLVEGARVLTESVAVAGVPLLRVTEEGETLHEAPQNGGVGHESWTVLV